MCRGMWDNNMIRKMEEQISPKKKKETAEKIW
jgi:hypothetical protein